MRNRSVPPLARRRGPLARWSSALVALLYLLAWGEPVGMHACPMHDGMAMVAMADGAAHATAHTSAHAPAHATAHASAHDGAHAAAGAHLAPAAPAAPDDGAHACQCLGLGCCPIGVVAPTAQAIRWQVVVRRRADVPEAPRTAPLPARIAGFLPFANGPPALS